MSYVHTQRGQATQQQASRRWKDGGDKTQEGEEDGMSRWQVLVLLLVRVLARKRSRPKSSGRAKHLRRREEQTCDAAAAAAATAAPQSAGHTTAESSQGRHVLAACGLVRAKSPRTAKITDATQQAPRARTSKRLHHDGLPLHPPFLRVDQPLEENSQVSEGVGLRG